MSSSRVSRQPSEDPIVRAERTESSLLWSAPISTSCWTASKTDEAIEEIRRLTQRLRHDDDGDGGFADLRSLLTTEDHDVNTCALAILFQDGYDRATDLEIGFFQLTTGDGRTLSDFYLWPAFGNPHAPRLEMVKDITHSMHPRRLNARATAAALEMLAEERPARES